LRRVFLFPYVLTYGSCLIITKTITMRKLYLLLLMVCTFVCATFFYSCQQADGSKVFINEDKDEEHEGYDGPMLRDQFEADRIKDPALGYVPYDRLFTAINYTHQLKTALPSQRLQALLWEERGPTYDTVGPSNGNTRAGFNYTAGRIRGVLVDTLNDPTGNTVFCGGVAGGLWKCTNFLSAIPNWTPVNDYFDNLAVSSICQDPSNPSIMYFATGEATSNADAVLGKGVWKSVNAGLTWTQLAATTNFIRNYKIICDNAGNIYLAARTTATPASQLNGLMRSKNGGTTWENITPTLVGTATATATCTDLELASNGKLYASFGYSTAGSTMRAYVTTDPANVAPGTGWTLGTGIRSTGLPAVRMELAAIVDTVYAVTINTAYNTDSCYKSIDGGVTWIKQNTTVMPAGLGSGQGWYNLTLSINPANSNELISGGLDAYRSINGGTNWTRITFWVTTAPYVHADHHFIQWWQKNGESRVLIGCDGGLFLSRDNGVTWTDKNRNLAIKQFYAGAIHPAAGSPYLLAGAQDNGTHQLKYGGLGPSIEVTGGDGCFVHINQVDPQVQFGSYVYNQYRRSVNGGQTWTSVNLSGSQGLFVNPFDYDDAQNIMYASNGNGQVRRWPNANTASVSTVLTIASMVGGNLTSFKVSPHTPNRVFIGSSNGRVCRLDNASTVVAADIDANATIITGAGFTGNVSCINTGTSDNVLVAVMSNYGINNVWHTTDGGTTWAAIDGNLPDMPVRWALFEPGRNDRLILATEAGIYSTDLVNGAATIWQPHTTFPTVRTDMLKMRTSDSTIVAATHGRGLFTAKIPASAAIQPQVTFVNSSTPVSEQVTTVSGCRSYADYTVNLGLANAADANTTVTLNVVAGNTATGVVDFEFTTNGNFATPSNQLVYAVGTTGIRPVTVRIYDDQEVEAIESFAIRISLSGTSNAVAGPIITHTLTIGDNDVAPFTPASLSATIGNASTNVTQPFRGQFSDARTQSVYLASELTAAGITAGTITSIAFNVTAKNSTVPYENFSIKMKNTNTAVLNGGAFEAGATQVYGPVNYSTVAGTNTFTLVTPFVWDGVSNVLVDICYDNAAATGTATDNVAGTSGIQRCHFDRVDNTAGCALPNGAFIFTGGARPDMSFSINTTGTIVASVLNSTKTNYLGTNNDLYYFNASGEIMAKVKNLSTHDYGCTEVVIDRAGTGATAFWNSTAANYLMNKTFRVIPATNNATGRYEVTFYFTRAEKEGWEAATGRSWNDIQLVKVPSAIRNVTAAIPQPDGPGTVQVVTPTRGTFGQHYTLTYTFDNGFSGFGAGIPGRMNTTLVLSGSVTTTGNALTWTTSAEILSTQFQVEKSYDGVNFFQLTTVNGAGTKYTPSTYNYTDADFVEIIYYRVRLLHSDGVVLLSNTIMLRNTGAKQELYVHTNPFGSQITIRFGRVPAAGTLVFSLYDAGGKLVKRSYFAQSGLSTIYNFNTSNIVSTGIYFIDVFADGKHFRRQVMKQ
jgi:trimeric autotransporter adhesin